MREPTDGTHNDITDSDPIVRVVRETFADDVPEDLSKEMDAFLAGFREDLHSHPYVRGLERQGSPTPRDAAPRSKGAFGRLAWVGSTVLLISVVLGAFLLGNDIPTWAEVVERFASVPSFSAVVYRRDDAFATPEQYEFWANGAGRRRVRSGTQVVFAEGGDITKCFDVVERREIEPTRQVAMMLEALGESGSFSLDTLIREFCGDWVDSTPKVNAEEIVSQDLAVFDVKHSGSPEWLRVWALRESKLPVHIRSWDPRDGECLEIFFTYSKGQPDAFFDPEAFALKVKDSSVNKAGLAYAFLEDPMDKQVVSRGVNEDLVFETVTRTLDGEPWSLGENRGKTILIGFWSTSGFEYEPWWTDIRDEFGDREDFVMVGVALDAEAAPVRTRCEEDGIDWLQLHEPGKGLDNSLAQVFGDAVQGRSWLIWKDGEVERVDHETQVRAAFQGLTYETEGFIGPKISGMLHTDAGMNADRARDLCGEPTEIVTQDGYETWRYELPSPDESSAYTVSLTVDPGGKIVNFIAQHRILNPALVKVYIGEGYWKENIESQIDPEFLPKQGHKYGVALSGKSGNRGLLIGAGHPWTGVQPGESYLRQTYPGSYDLYLAICDKRTLQSVQEIPLRMGVELIAGETREVRLEGKLSSGNGIGENESGRP